MSNINMNKYDAAQSMNVGTSSKMSMDYQQTATMENSIRAGSDIQQYEKQGLSHQGTTFMRNQDGELLRMTGTYEQTAGGWKFNGNVQNLSTGETYTGNKSGMAKDMNSMQQGLNVDDISMTGKERQNLGDVRGNDVAFIQGTVVDSNLSASDVVHKDTIDTENISKEKNVTDRANNAFERINSTDTSDITKNNKIHEAKTVDDTSTLIDKSKTNKANDITEAKRVNDTSVTIDRSYTNKNNYTNEEKYTDDTSVNINSSHNENSSRNINRSYNENNSQNINNSTTFSTGTQYKGVAQAAMGKTADFESMMTRLSDMKQSVLNGDMSAKEFQAEVRNFSGAYAQEMSSFLVKKENEAEGTNTQANASVSGNVSLNSSNTLYGKATQAVTGLSGSVGAGVSGGIGYSRSDSTSSAQNLIAKEMYDTIMSSGNSNDMINNASNLANKHINTDLNNSEDMSKTFGEMTEKAKDMGKGAVEGGKNMVNGLIK